MAPSAGDSFHLPLLHKWEHVFNDRRSFPVDEDKPYVAIQQAINPHLETITLFAGSGDIENCLNEDEVKMLEDFCSEARSLQAFQSGNPDPEKLVALLDDSDFEGKRRPHPAALTARTLFEALRIPRFHRQRHLPVRTEKPSSRLSSTKKIASPEEQVSDVGESGGFSGAEGSSHNTEREPVAERRLLYVTNLDQWTIFALAATVSSHQGDMLRRFICDHLGFKAGVDVSITMEGRRQFALTFHLPTYALKKTASGPSSRDPRSLRKMEDVTFLRGADPGDELEYLHPVQLSCAVAGQDQHIWMAYLFADTYHEGLDDDDLEDYGSQIAELGRGFEMEDPLVGKPVGRPIRKPREYFLKVLAARSSQARQEWMRTVDHVLNHVEARRRSHYSSPSHEHSHATAGDIGSEAAKRSESRRQNTFLHWITRVIELIGRLSTTLDGSIEAWRTFSAGDVRCFYARDHPLEDQPLNIAPEDQWMLLTIAKNFADLAKLLRRLDRVNEDLKSIRGKAN